MAQKFQDLYVKKFQEAELLIADGNTGWRYNPAARKIDVNVGTFKPGVQATFKIKFEGQKLTISQIKAHCPCTKNIYWKLKEDEDLGRNQIVTGTIDVLTLDEIKASDEQARNGAQIVARMVAIDVLYAESEIEHFLFDEETNSFEVNPMSFYSRININYNIDLT